MIDNLDLRFDITLSIQTDLLFEGCFRSSLNCTL